MVKRMECDNCLRWLYLLTPDAARSEDLKLCLCCSVYARLYNSFRHFSVSIDNDAFVKAGLEEESAPDDDEEE